MKKTSKALLLMLCAVLLVAASVLGTMAYLTSTDTVTNTFTVGNVKITLDEQDVDDSTPNADRDQANSYKLLPGHTYTKDPTVHVQPKSEKSYIRMIVTVNGIDKLKAAIPASSHSEYYSGDVFLLEKLVVNKDGVCTWDSTKWVCTKATANGVYEFRYHTTVSNDNATATSLEPLFTDITIPGFVKNTELSNLNGVSIDVVAHAIQADGFANADAAWEAFAG